MKGPGGLSLWMWLPPSPVQTIPLAISKICVGAIHPWLRPSKGGAICPPLALVFATAGGPQKIQCWNTEGIFRLIQSIPSPKAEPFKRWLVRVGKERAWVLEEMQRNPELKKLRVAFLIDEAHRSQEGQMGAAIRVPFRKENEPDQDVPDEDMKERIARIAREHDLNKLFVA